MTSFADISHHQGVVDLTKYKAAGHDRVIIKATEGTGFTDPLFNSNWVEAGRLGLKRVAYHFQRAKFDGAHEFDFFYAVVQEAGGMRAGDWLCLDSEDTDTPHRAAANAKEFTNRAVARGMKYGLVYTGRWYGLPNGIKSSILPPGWRKLWISDYTPGQADTAIELWPGWTRAQVAARQYTDRATVAGVNGRCDYNRVLKDWTTAVDAVSTDTKDWFTMATEADLETALRKVLNEGAGAGTNGWASTERALLAGVQTNYNRINEANGKLDAMRAELDAVKAKVGA